MSKGPSMMRDPVTLPKALTGIGGLDEITGGGLPKGRPSLICGTAGCGKTLFSMEFLVRGATQFNEPGVFIAFEESAEELAQNVASLGFDLNQLVRKKKLLVDYIRVDPNEIQENGDYDLEGLFIRLGHAIDSIGAKRVVLDTVEALFSGLTNQLILRSELARLFRWLKEKGVTAVITAERGDGALTRHGLEEYVADCVVLLDHRVTEQVSTRRLRIVKYRGSHHGTNEYPFLIDEKGISVLPITSLGLSHDAPRERVSSGIEKLDSMLGGAGYYRGSSILVSGTAGTGKSSLAASFISATCRRGERALYLSFEESPAQILRNMRSINLELSPYVAKGLLKLHSLRPTSFSLEMHLVLLQKLIQECKPSVVVIDPITNLTSVGSIYEVKAALTRIIDYLKLHNITALFTSLTPGGADPDQTEVGVSSLMDTWLLLRNIETHGERNRGLYVLKSRGMAHSNQVREFIITPQGIDLVEVYVGTGTFLTGSARKAQEAREHANEMSRLQAAAKKRRDFDRKRKALEAQITALQTQLEVEEEEMNQALNEFQQLEQQEVEGLKKVALSRGATLPNGARKARKP